MKHKNPLFRENFDKKLVMQLNEYLEGINPNKTNNPKIYVLDVGTTV